MRISRQFTVDDWKALKFKDEVDWERAISMFLDRLESRYLEHIDTLLKQPTSGFAVLSLDCALIETLQQFREGTQKTPERKVGQYFRSFLTTGYFAQYFDVERADLFYRNIRCGLLHQTEAGGNSRVKRGNGRPLVAYTEDRKDVVINVQEFHTVLKATVQAYAEELKRPESVAARKAFRSKMNFICRVEAQDIAQDPLVAVPAVQQARAVDV
jgi:hypothetical protein